MRTIPMLLGAAALVGVLVLAAQAEENARPREFGQVEWIRTIDAGVSKAETAKKPILLLFQEVPG